MNRLVIRVWRYWLLSLGVKLLSPFFSYCEILTDTEDMVTVLILARDKEAFTGRFEAKSLERV